MSQDMQISTFTINDIKYYEVALATTTFVFDQYGNCDPPYPAIEGLLKQVISLEDMPIDICESVTRLIFKREIAKKKEQIDMLQKDISNLYILIAYIET